MRLKIAVFVCIIAASVQAQDLAPATITITNRRPESVESITNQTFYKGEDLLFTNCAVWSDGTGTVQNLTNQTILVQVGDDTRWTTATGTVQVASNGTWWALVQIPQILKDVASIYVRATNATRRVTFAAKTVPLAAPLD